MWPPEVCPRRCSPRPRPAASVSLNRRSRWLPRTPSRPVVTWEAALASYLIFDVAYAQRLIEIGRVDAHARATEIRDFFAD